MTLVKDHSATSLFPSLSEFFENENWAPEKLFRNFGHHRPSANISETEKDFKIELAAPGFKKDDLKIDLENEVLTVSAENKNETQESTKKYTRKEFSFNSFSRSFQLPKSADITRIHAKYENGLLKLDIPKKEEAAGNYKKEVRIS